MLPSYTLTRDHLPAAFQYVWKTVAGEKLPYLISYDGHKKQGCIAAAMSVMSGG